MPTTITMSDLEEASANALVDMETLDSKVNGAPGTVTDRHGTTTNNLEKIFSIIGYEVPVAFASGLTPTSGAFTVEYSGQVYAANPSSVPFTTTSTFNASEWLLIDASNGTYNQGGAGAVDRSVQSRLQDGYSVKDFGAVGDDVTDDSVAFNSAVNAANTAGGAVVNCPSGIYKLDSEIVMPLQDVSLDFGKSTAKLYASSAFNFGWNDPNQCADCEINGGRFELRTDNAIFCRVQNAYAPRFTDLNLRLYNPGQTGFYITGNGAPYTGPYYGTMDNIRIFGNGTPGDTQYGMRFFGLPVDGSFGVNRWILSNIRHIAAVDFGLDFVDAHGFVVNGINFEGCYNTGVRFNARVSDYDGSVTTGGSNAVLTDTAFSATAGFNSASIEITSGANTGWTSNVDYVSGNQVFLESPPPYNFSVGDTYSLYQSKARNIVIHGATCETAGIAADFQKGARDCRVEYDFITIEAGSYYFRRGIEDMANTVARRYDKFTFDGEVPAGGGTVWLSPLHVASTRGGATTVEGAAWVDAVYCSSSTRSIGGAGEISINTYVNGVDQGANMTPILTADQPWRQRRVRKELTSANLAKANSPIKVTATGDGALASNEHVRVEVYVGYL